MTCQILVSNQSNIAQCEIMLVADGNHQWSKNETMQAWIASGETAETWGRSFALIIVTDKTKEELSYLLDPLVENIDGNLTAVGNKYHFLQPAQGSEIHQTLIDTGQVSAPYSTVEQYISERFA